MKTVFVKLETIEKVKKFVNTISDIDGDFDLIAGRYVINAKSIMGIFSIDLSQKLQLNIYNDSNEVLKLIDPFVVD